MDSLLDTLIEQVFSKLDRSYLLVRYKRQELVDYLCTLIQGYCAGEEGCDLQTGYKKVVEAAVRYHETSRSTNSDICLLGKYHDVLYVACKLCYLRELRDPSVLRTLLHAIYRCEDTLEKFFEGSIFGPNVTKMISGWKSDYPTREENLSVFRYFLKRANELKMVFDYRGAQRKFVDIPMNSYGQHSPLKVAVKAGRWDVVQILVKHGAILYLPTVHEDFDKYSIFGSLYQLVEELGRYEPASTRNSDMIDALRVICRAVPHIPEFPADTEQDWTNIIRILKERSIVWNEPPTLKHLARCGFREHLNQYYSLPNGIYASNIPKSLQNYLDLSDD